MIPQCVILAGGRGTRLGMLTRNTPKPMLPVAGRPFIRHLVDQVAGQGCRDIVVLAGYLGKQIAEEFHSGRTELGTRIRVLIEPKRMGTAGALQLSAEVLDAQFLLLNGDTYFDIDLAALSVPLPTGDDGPRLGRLALRPMDDTGRFGVVERAGTRITRFLPARESSRAGEINGGVYYLDRRLLCALERDEQSLEQDVFPRLAETGALHGLAFQQDFIDIGVPEDYERAQCLLARAMSRGRTTDGTEGGERPVPMSGSAPIPVFGAEF